jgi:translation initiation factor IF-2
MNYDILTEEFGGEVQTAQVSAKKGVGIQELLDKILIQSELMNLKAATDMPAEGTVIEARMDKRVGVIATALVREGTLKVGDYVLAGASWGRVRKLLSDQGAKLESAGPTMPVQVRDNSFF